MPCYSSRPFPPYRYLHGLAPHPTADPAGHSHGVDGEEEGGVAGYLYGVDLYNHGCWWEAHEAWEGVWMRLERGTAARLAVQGLIQTANAQLKLELGRRNAVERLRVKYAELFDKAGAVDDAAGFDLAAWRARTDAYIAARMARETMHHDIARYPVIDLSDEPRF